MRFKNLEGKSERESPKRIISASGGLRPLQMISEPDTERCASKEAKLQRGVARDGVPAKTLGPYMGRCASKNVVD